MPRRTPGTLLDLEKALLAELSVGGATHGHDLVTRLNDEWGGLLDRKSVAYRTLRRLESMGYLKSRWDTNGGPPRRVYSLTAKGRKALRDEEP